MRNLTLLLLALVCGCASLPPSELEAIRAVGVRSRERLPHHPVGGAGTLAQAQAFVATGEAEEIDYWRFTTEPTSAERAALRTALDGAGGRAVQILGPDEKFVRRSYAPALQVSGRLDAPVLLAGTDRALAVNPDGRVAWEKRGCGNIHTVRPLGNFVYYSNGALYRVPYNCDTWANPECVWKAANVVGGGVLCFDLTADGTFVFGVNSTEEVVELDPATRQERVRFAIDAHSGAKDGAIPAHGRIRGVHKTAAGTYLVSCAGLQQVREYDAQGRLLKTVASPNFVFDAIVRRNGNILLSHVSGLTEVAPDGSTVWTLTPADVAASGALNFTAVQELANGHLVVGTWANGARQPLCAGAFEVTADKQIVWSLASATDVNLMTAFKLEGGD